MQLGMVGLGRMGGNIVRRLLQAGHACVAYDRDPAPGAALAAEGATAVADLPAMVAALDAPRAIWVMLPAGAATEEALVTLAGLLSPGDVLIDGGNSFWKDGVRRGAMLRAKGLHFLDIGTSGESRPARVTSASSVASPAGSMTQMARGASSAATIAGRSATAVAPSAAKAAPGAGSRS